MSDLPRRDPTKPKTEQGLYRKFNVSRTDFSDAPGRKHHGCEYFVLDVTHDPLAKPALAAYAAAAVVDYPQLAVDMHARYRLKPGSHITDWELVERVAQHMAKSIYYIEQVYEGAPMLDRGPIMRNMKRWRDRLQEAVAQRHTVETTPAPLDAPPPKFNPRPAERVHLVPRPEVTDAMVKSAQRTDENWASRTGWGAARSIRDALEAALDSMVVQTITVRQASAEPLGVEGVGVVLPPAEAQPVAWIAQCELDSLAGTPEGQRAHGLVWAKPTGQAGVPLYPAPPSAPVGVFARAARCLRRLARTADSDDAREAEAHAAKLDALAQQPAADPRETEFSAIAASAACPACGERGPCECKGYGEQPASVDEAADRAAAEIEDRYHPFVRAAGVSGIIRKHIAAQQGGSNDG